MSCYHPLLIKQIGVVDGKAKTVISKLKPGMDTTGCAVVPCGQCIGCRIDYSRQWADRCILEAQEHEQNWFVTLTYDDYHIKDTCRRTYIDSETGEEKEIMSLNKRDLQKFHKDLRNALAERDKKAQGVTKYSDLDKSQTSKIRFFACGEYGSPSKTMRPHFHDIVFGLKLTDLVCVDYNELKQPLYESKWLSDIWQKGKVVIGEVTWQSCAYVARYVTKKLKGEASTLYSLYNLTPPFVLMSRKPGIAGQYYENHPEMFDYNYINISTEDGGRKIYPPRYFKSRLEKDDPEKYKEVRLRSQESAEIKWNSKNALSQLDAVDQLALEESLLNDRIRILDRKGV